MPVREPLAGKTPCASCRARSCSVCGAIAVADLAWLAALALPLDVAAGAAFMAEGDPAEHLFNITGGHARLFKLLPDGRRQIIGFARAGQFLGLAAASAYTVTAEAVDRVRLCRFSRARLHGLTAQFPQMERRLFDAAASELAAAQDQIVLLGRKTARERIASFLVGWAHGDRVLATRIQVPMPRGDIADYLGLTVETVSRTLTSLRVEGLLAMPTASDITLLDVAALIAIASGQRSSPHDVAALAGPDHPGARPWRSGRVPVDGAQRPV